MGCCASSADSVVNPNFIDNSHFEYMKVVGKGGFGKVNAVIKKSNNEFFAIKRVNKFEVLKKDPTLYTVGIEFDIMTRVQSPFCLHLVHAFQTETELCMVMPFMRGGDLRYYLETHGAMPEDMARFYCAELLLGLEDLHSLKIVWRDMKPENCLFQEDGHVKLSDYGISVQLSDSAPLATGRAGTQGYQAPELLNREPYSYSVDVWSFGVTLYELLHGRIPKASFDGERTVECSSKLSADAVDLIRKLLTANPKHRIGCGARRLDEIKAHPWLKSIDWQKFQRREVPAPFTPDPERANCSNRFSLEDEMTAVSASDDEPVPTVSAEQQTLFARFEYRNKIGGTQTSASASDPVASSASAPSPSSASSSSTHATASATSSSAPSTASDASLVASIPSAVSPTAVTIESKDKEVPIAPRA